jgi:hypothetical protein
MWAARFDPMAERELDFRIQMSRRDRTAVRLQRLAAGFATPIAPTGSAASPRRDSCDASVPPKI